KHQLPGTKFQTKPFDHWDLVLGIYLEFGIRCLEFIWNLGFGAWNLSNGGDPTTGPEATLPL
ncbi:MAG: hypothetical protein JXA24_00505, partial [Proteobacteria bacterium]|nr:hypothetical protein [Pseudomonadota bacterium]